jgi:hypothetical protein
MSFLGITCEVKHTAVDFCGVKMEARNRELIEEITRELAEHIADRKRAQYWAECEKIYDDIKSGRLILY